MVSIMFSACQKEVVEPEYRIEGYYVLDDGSNLTNQYILFKDASVSVFKAQQKLVFIEDRIWNFNSKFSRLSTSLYSIQNGVLNSDIWKDTPIKLENGVLKFGEKTYSAWSGQTERECYSSINVAPTREVSYIAQVDTIPYSIGKPIPSGHLTAVSGESWLTVENVSNNKIVIHLDENNSGGDRSCNLQLNYYGDAAATCLVTQKWAASSFILTPESQNTDYNGGDYSFSFAIDNPRESFTVSAASQVNWITDVVISGSNVNFKVAENNSGAQRSGNIRLSYGNFAAVNFTVTQDWAASSFILTPENQNTDYTGGDYSFSFAVENPREGVTVTAASQANWITDVAISGSNVNYKVAENYSNAQRSGKIKLTYGSYAKAEFTVTQKGTPVTSLSLNKSNLALHPGNSEKLVATVEPSDATLVWSSSNTSVATVSSDGTVTAAGNGTASITVSATDGSGKNATCTVAVTTLVSSISLDKTSLDLYKGDSFTLSATVSPSTASNKALTWTSSNISVATVSNSGVVAAAGNGTATITVSATDGSGKNDKCKVTVSIRPPEAIDMGTVVNGKNIKWASFNLGASKPEEYGLYYAWGETEPKGNYSWSTYKWCNGSSSTLTKYNNSSSYGTVDNKKVLEASDDVASVNLGGKWRMPTEAEWRELKTKCTWTWTTNYNGTGVKGRIVTAPNGNSIFLPAAGCRYGTDLKDAGSNGYYWYSSLNRSNPLRAWIVGFFSDNVYLNDSLRYSGHSVRPVSE